MTKINNKTIAKTFAFIFMFSLLGMNTAFAATTPSLGTATNYGVLANTYTNTTSGTVISGNVGYKNSPSVNPAVNNGSTNNNNNAYTQAGADQANALSALNTQPCTVTFNSGSVDLYTDTTHGTAGVYTPGVYCITGSMTISGTINLSGNGTFLFRPSGYLTTNVGATVTVSNGASVCNVFWTPGSETSMSSNTGFAGTVIDNSGITIGSNSVIHGQMLSYIGNVVTNASDIDALSCTNSTNNTNTTNTTTNANGVSTTVTTVTVVTENAGSIPGSPTYTPTLPSTGFAPQGSTNTSIIVLVLSAIAVVSATVLVARKNRKLN
jgi:hypothetical protein